VLFTAVLFTAVLLALPDQAEPIVDTISRSDKERHVRNSIIPNTFVVALIKYYLSGDK
jgi:hypothetical protein